MIRGVQRLVFNRHVVAGAAGGWRRRTVTSRWCSSQPTQTAQQQAGQNLPSTKVTFEERAKAATTGGIWLGIAGLVGVCGFYIGKELMPTSMSPNTIFNNSFELLRNHPEVTSRLGDNIKGYGGDYNRRKEGRRNFVEHDQYRDLDGIKRMRIKFNMEGSNGKAVIYTEVAENMEKGEFAYIIIEQNHRGRREAVALVDNRPNYTRPEIQEKVVARLNKAGAKLYGVSNCPWTQRQLLELGEYAEQLQVLMCDKDEYKAACDKAMLTGYPTWEFGSGDKLAAFQQLEDLQNICLQLQ